MNLVKLKVASVGVLMLFAAGCGAEASTGGYPSGHTPSTPTTASTVIRGQTSPLGRIIVDHAGRTLYLFEKDTPGSSACYGTCAGIWPPLTTTTKVTPAAGLTARVGTFKRSDGTMQVTYNGHPLYYYVGDASAGQTKGQALDQFGAEWYVLAPTGNKVDNG